MVTTGQRRGFRLPPMTIPALSFAGVSLQADGCERFHEHGGGFARCQPVGVREYLAEASCAGLSVHQSEHVAGDAVHFQALFAVARELGFDVGDHGFYDVGLCRRRCVVAVKAPVEFRHAPGIMVGGASDHDAIDLFEVPRDFVGRFHPAVYQDFQFGKVFFEPVNDVIAQRRDVAVFFRGKSLEDGVSGVDDEGTAPRFGDFADEVADKVVGMDVIDADAVFDGHVDGDGVAHGGDAARHQRRFFHEACAERAFLHAFGRATAIEVDFVISPFFAEFRALGEIVGFAPAQLQGDGMFFVAEIEMPRDVAVKQRAGRDHFGVKPGMAADEPVEIAAMPVCPVQHRGDGEGSGLIFHQIYRNYYNKKFNSLTCCTNKLDSFPPIPAFLIVPLINLEIIRQLFPDSNSRKHTL